MMNARPSFGPSALCAALVCAAVPCAAQIQTAKVTGGVVEGVVTNGIATFKGIPFAAPPVGDLRWKAPQPLKAWSGVKKADDFGPAPMQDIGMAMGMMGGNKLRVSEDCLYLNVWTPAKKADEKLPVMVWIYGGGFAMGMTNTPMNDGVNFAKKGVVLVSVAYRVGPIGFLAHPDLSKESGKGSGCYGIQDQVAGLKWVKDNIAQFGGDPSRVTIFGESAGAISVSMLAASPKAKGLFQRAISESGGSMAPVKYGNEAGQNVPCLKMAEAQGKAFLAKLGANDLKAARALSAETIQKGGGPMGHFWPAADGETILGDQYEQYEAGNFNDTPILIGTNSDEGAMFSRGGVTPEAFEKQVRGNFGPAADGILKAYPHATGAESSQSQKDLFRESAFAWHTWAWAKLVAEKNKQQKVFVYYFDHHPAGMQGSTHASEIPYVFANLGGPVAPTPEDVKMSDLMHAYWINFAKNADPNGPGLPVWPAFENQGRQTMFFDAASSARPLPNLDKLQAFDAYYAWRRAQAKTQK